MTKIAILTDGRLSDFSTDFELSVGVDHGSLFLLKSQLPLDLVMRGSDPVGREELRMIQEEVGNSVKTAPGKDDTDTELALKTIFSKYPRIQVTIFDAFDGRIDHTMPSLFLPSDPELVPFMRQIALHDEQNIMWFYPVDSNQVLSEKEVIYISFMISDDAGLTIKDAKYELDANNFFKKKIYSGSEFLDQPITIVLKSGYFIVIRSKDR